MKGNTLTARNSLSSSFMWFRVVMYFDVHIHLSIGIEPRMTFL